MWVVGFYVHRCLGFGIFEFEFCGFWFLGFSITIIFGLFYFLFLGSIGFEFLSLFCFCAVRVQFWVIGFWVF